MQGAPAESTPSADSPLVIGRYAIYDAIASGGMATVHLGRLIGPVGFLRTVAVKRLHANLAHDAEFVAMFLDEARLAARIQHPNVVPTLDVVMSGQELLLVMEYVRGDSLSRLMRRARDAKSSIPPRIVAAILSGALHGLHAAHEAVDEKGRPLGLVHRDMSPQNVLVGADGIARVLDFGIAKAEGRVSSTKNGDIKGKVLYMPPEQLAAEPLTRTADIYSAGVVLFEVLTGVRMFAGESERASITKIIKNVIRVPSEVDPALAAFDPIVRRATAGLPDDRYATAADMAQALDQVQSPASPTEVSAWVRQMVGDVLDERAALVAEIERSSTRSRPPLAAAEGLVEAGSSPASSPRIPPAPPAPNLDSDASFPGSATPSKPVPSTRRPGAAAFALLVTLVLGCLGVIAFLLATRGAKPAENVTRAAAAAGDDKAGFVPAAPVPSMTGPMIGPSASASASAVPTEASASAAPSSIVAPRPVASAHRGAAPHAAANCDPPWVVDKSGHRHFLPECVK